MSVAGPDPGSAVDPGLVAVVTTGVVYSSFAVDAPTADESENLGGN